MKGRNQITSCFLIARIVFLDSQATPVHLCETFQTVRFLLTYLIATFVPHSFVEGWVSTVTVATLIQRTLRGTIPAN